VSQGVPTLITVDAVDAAGRAVLTPVQRKMLDELIEPPGPRPVFDDLLPLRLVDRLEAGIAPVVDDMGPGALAVNKSALARVHQCERFFVVENEARFEWSVAAARGTIAHRALGLSLTMRDVPPLDLVDEAMARIADDGDDWTPRRFLRSASTGELAELRASAGELVAKFQECCPPLRTDWRPRIESPLRVELCADRVVLRAKIDLALHRACGNEARTVLVDFKSGRPHAGHLDDLRFYALVETIRLGVPPFRLAAYYLDAARWQHEDVTEELLEVAARRVVAGVRKLAELRYSNREPEFTPSAACTYCRARDTCPGPNLRQ